MKKLLLFISLFCFAFSSECLFATEQAVLQRISSIITKAPCSDKKFAIDDFATFPINALIYGGMHTYIGVFQEGTQYIAYYSGYDGHADSDAKYSFHKTKDEAILAAINLHPVFKHAYKQQLVARLLKQAESTKLDTPTSHAGIRINVLYHDGMSKTYVGILQDTESSQYIVYYSGYHNTSDGDGYVSCIKHLEIFNDGDGHQVSFYATKKEADQAVLKIWQTITEKHFIARQITDIARNEKGRQFYPTNLALLKKENTFYYLGPKTFIAVLKIKQDPRYIAYYSGENNQRAKYSFHTAKEEAWIASENFKTTQVDSVKTNWLQKFSNLSAKSKSMLALGAIVCGYIGGYQLSNYFSSK